MCYNMESVRRTSFLLGIQEVCSTKVRQEEKMNCGNICHMWNCSSTEEREICFCATASNTVVTAFLLFLYFTPSSPVLPLPTHLYSQDAKDNEEGTADDHDVSNGLQWGHQSLHHQLQSWSSADNTATQNSIGLLVHSCVCVCAREGVCFQGTLRSLTVQLIPDGAGMPAAFQPTTPTHPQAHTLSAHTHIHTLIHR